MNRDKVKVLIISVVIISFTILVFLGGIKLYNNSYSNFKLNGYIIASKNDTKSERYYFNENQKYKKTVNKNVVFETTSKNSVSVFLIANEGLVLSSFILKYFLFETNFS